MTQYGVVLVTVDTQEVAQEIATALVTEQLAACVNLFPIHSVYRWEGEVQQSAEWQLVIKTNLGQFGAIEQALQTLHPYDVPEILALPIQAGSKAYLDWIADSVEQGTGHETP
ncbi:divalent-cation tolerance protein CutA [Oscillatoria sp. CS-180]|uniref:divalent-cation tolerance protein CutA n=1 Tax=Oscillatoria sp. CS-180 TaxID=3021720 RepID=UPI00232FFCFA|nr:divalent-cation tolerance protein CutA [Oscillatoria sp. CS-180]MDB9525055.1 divalent-cation tolerance protein CutA [Oscillatoria sp. CS-180]